MSEMIEMDEVMGDSNVPTEGTGTMPQVYDGVFMLPLTAIVHDPFFDCRVALDEEVIERYTGRYRGYKEAIERGEERDYPFPPIWVWYHNKQFVRITGSLRFQSAQNAGIDYIEAEVFLGTKAEALELALVDNAATGAPVYRITPSSPRDEWQATIDRTAQSRGKISQEKPTDLKIAVE